MTCPSRVASVSVPPHQDRATGGLYRSAHAARDGDRPKPDSAADGATLISADDPVPGAGASEQQALPPNWRWDLVSRSR